MNDDEIALRIIKRQQQIASLRTVFESQWVEVDRYVTPSPNRFFTNNPPQGGKVAQWEFDSTASLALRKFAAAIESVVTPRTSTWHSLATANPSLNENHDIKVYLEEIVRRLFSIRYSANANFASQANEIYESLGKYGTGCMFVEDDLEKGIVYRAIHLSELYIAENSLGKIDTVYRRFSYTASQAIDAWGNDNLPDVIKEQADINPDQIFDFIHAVEPNPDYRIFDINSKEFNSTYVSITGQQVIETNGYYTMPYCVCRYNKNTGEIYGRGPAIDVLADIKMVNVMSKTDLNAAQLAVNPPLLMPAKSVLSVFNLVPGALNPGALTSDGRPMVTPLQTGSQIQMGETMAEQRRSVINDAFLISLFQILVETPQMTATEAMLRAQEKGDLLAPSMGRIQSELLGPMIQRELDILKRSGLLPPLPPSISPDEELIIKYVSPLNKAQRAPEAIAIMQMIETMGTMAQFDQSIINKVDFGKCLEIMGEITGVPAEVFYTDEQVAAMKQAQLQQAQLQQLTQAAPIAAQTAKTLQETQNLAGQPTPGFSR